MEEQIFDLMHTPQMPLLLQEKNTKEDEINFKIYNKPLQSKIISQSIVQSYHDTAYIAYPLLCSCGGQVNVYLSVDIKVHHMRCDQVDRLFDTEAPIGTTLSSYWTN